MRRSILTLAALLGLAAPAHAQGPQDATVVAIIDSGFNPYHWDFAASKAPPATRALPLHRPMSEWLEGAPQTTDLDLTLDAADPDTRTADLASEDTAALASMKPGELYRIPGTKIIGAARFGTSNLYGGVNAHGFGTSSSAVGNLHGTCPECLVVLLQYTGAPAAEDAIEWAMDQPWIDVISNSYGFSLVARDRLYSKSNTDAQRVASERGQTIFFSAGNGQNNDFVAPNTTDFSSQEGPDWIVTVGAVTQGPNNRYAPGTPPFAPYTGTGKPADVAGIGTRYPTGYSSATVGGTGGSGFSGTSNATPQVAGTYARALWLARQDMAGPSRTQADGVVATGDGAGGALADGTLTATELRTALFHGAKPTTQAARVGTYGGVPARNRELELAAIGYGFYAGREDGKLSTYLEEFDTRVYGPLRGSLPAIARPADEALWFVADSFCRQSNWGQWTGGAWRPGQALPTPNPEWPVRSQRANACLGGPTPVN